jgi:peptide/nickel transport system permease protein
MTQVESAPSPAHAPELKNEVPVSARIRFRNPFNSRSGRRLLHNWPAMISLSYLVALIVVAIVGPFVVAHDPAEQDVRDRYAAPSSEHWLGTDGLGRDVLSRLVDSTSVALLATAQAVGIAILVGGLLGLVAGYAGGFLDSALSRLFDALMSLPPLIFAVAIVGVLGPGLTNAMLAIGVLLTPSFFRIVRGSTLTVRSATFVESARAIGCSSPRILFRHVLPSISSPLLVQVSFAAGITIVAESSLSFIGLGAQPPQASWGSMLADAFNDMANSGSQVFPPAIITALTILAFSLLGDGLRDALGRQIEGSK